MSISRAEIPEPPGHFPSSTNTTHFSTLAYFRPDHKDHGNNSAITDASAYFSQQPQRKLA